MFNPLPAIALLPLALLWFGLGKGSLLFVIVHSVLWPLALGTYAGFQSCRTPCAWPAATTACRPALCAAHPGAGRAAVHPLRPEDRLGLRLAHLIAAELVFGTTAGKGTWLVHFQNRNELYTDKVFAGLAAVILIGLLVETWHFVHKR
jgi:NitT/TauT family transport system permease protein